MKKLQEWELMTAQEIFKCAERKQVKITTRNTSFKGCLYKSNHRRIKPIIYGLKYAP